jgi:mannose-6-phosphate isomerase class I
MTPDRRPALLAPEPGPATLKHRPWGGARLAALRNAPADLPRPIGESWEFSTMPGSESRAHGQPLSAVLGRPLPFLAKLLDTARELSVQVHPDDDPDTGTGGKEEAWVVLDADPGTEVLVGVRDGVDATTLAAAVRDAADDPAHGDRLTALLQPIPVRAGTVVLVPAGAVHAIGGGILLAEIQQPSDCTYRLHDYGSERELHVAAGIAAARVDARATVWQPGDAPGTLRGRHLTLDVLAQGRHERVARADELLIPFAGRCLVTVAARSHDLLAGELRLATTRLRYVLDLPPGGGAVVGRIDAPTT